MLLWVLTMKRESDLYDSGAIASAWLGISAEPYPVDRTAMTQSG